MVVNKDKRSRWHYRLLRRQSDADICPWEFISRRSGCSLNKMKICQSSGLLISNSLSYVDHIKMCKTSIVTPVGWAICEDVFGVKRREMNMPQAKSFCTIVTVHHNTFKSRKSAGIQQCQDPSAANEWHKTIVIKFLGLSSFMSATTSNIS
jgi:hypothetical protein